MIFKSTVKQKNTVFIYVLISLCFLSPAASSKASANSSELVSNIANQSKTSKAKESSIENKEDFLQKLKAIDATEDNLDDTTQTPKEPITVYEDEEDEESESQDKKSIAKVYLTIAVPHTKNPVVKLKAYPYPPKPEKPSFPMPLPEDEANIKTVLLSSGYMNRTSFDNPFPSGGWRMQYALAKASKKSKISYPHSILEHYRWANKMVKYIEPEFIIINKFEAQRKERYYKYNTFWSDNHKVFRNKAVRLSLEPVSLRPLPRDPEKIGSNFGVVLPAGKWWIKGEYKIRGLVYHWIFKLDLKDKDKIVIIANEANALQISGGW